MTTNEENPHYDEDAFIKHLLEKYPAIFPKDKDGNTCEPRCGICCPIGWQRIVESLCSAINTRLLYTNTSVRNPDKWVSFKSWCHKLWTRFIHKPLYSAFDPLREWTKAEQKKDGYTGKGPWSKMIPKDVHEARKLTKRYAWRKKLDILNGKLRPQNQYLTKKVLEYVVVDQIKEKFGSLRFYITGGDDAVEGMIDLAETQSLMTCQATGNPGSLCRRGYWYATLSPEKAEMTGYKAVKDGEI